ncbi:MAG: ArnT family glycosyltransferase [Microgenomates group bacterium]
MFKRIIKNPIVWIFIFALVLRIYKLGTFPYGFHVDEVKAGWNALSIIQTGMDDHGNLLASYYNTFGDWRPTGIFYLTTLPIILLGRSEFAVRFSSSLFGALTVFPLYLIVYNLSKNKRLSLIASFLLSISPWHLITSRATSEVVISTFFALFGIYFFIKLINDHRKRFAYLSIGSFLASYCLYHSIRVLAPIFLVAITIYFLKDLKKRKDKKWVVIAFSIITFVSLFLGTSKEARERLGQVSISKDLDLKYEEARINSENKRRTIPSLVFDNKSVIYLRKLTDEYLKYFSTGFLTGNSAKPYRYVSPGAGLLTYIEFILLIVGLISIFKNKYSILPIILLLISPLSAALTIEDSPNLHRAFLMLPFILTIEAYGLNYLISLKKKVSPIIFLVLIANFGFFLNMYFNHSISHKPYIKDWVLDSSSYRDVGAKDLALKIESEKGDYDKIIITNFPDNVYPWYSFFTNKSPREFNKSILRNSNEVVYKNIIFSDVKCPSDFAFQKYSDAKILVVDNWECPTEIKIKDGLKAKVVEQISRSDGTLVYTFLERN